MNLISKKLVSVENNSQNLEQAIKHNLQNYGVCIVENYYSQSVVEQIKKEFEFAVTEKKVKQRDGSVFHFVAEDSTLSSLFKSLFEDKTVMNIAKWFFKKGVISFRRDAYIHRDEPRSSVNKAWHQDPTVGLKAYTYLADVDEPSGGLLYVVGSHVEGFFRLSYMRRISGNLHETLGYDFDYVDTRQVVDTSSNPGTLVLFNTAGLHRAGDVDLGSFREIVRVQITPIQSRFFRMIRAVSYNKKVPVFVRTMLHKVFPIVDHTSEDAFPRVKLLSQD